MNVALLKIYNRRETNFLYRGKQINVKKHRDRCSYWFPEDYTSKENFNRKELSREYIFEIP